jgi:hypothetical protein
MSGRVKAWHRETIAQSLEQTVLDLHQQSVLADFYLAGGTGMVLYLGHRRSLDLDFFKQELFDEEILLQQVQKLSGFSLVGIELILCTPISKGTKLVSSVTTIRCSTRLSRSMV